MGVWLFAVYALAVARVTGLVTADTITEPLRSRALDALNDRSHPSLASLISCQWCASIYVGAAATPLAWWHGRNPWLLIPAIALAFSQITGALSDLGRRE